MGVFFRSAGIVIHTTCGHVPAASPQTAEWRLRSDASKLLRRRTRGEEELVVVAARVGRSSSGSGAETQRVLWFPNGHRATWAPAAGASAEDLRQHVQIQKRD